MKYYYKTNEARKRHDQSRNEHISKIKTIETLVSESICGTESWLKLMKELTMLETQLTIYDREMGYE